MAKEKTDAKTQPILITRIAQLYRVIIKITEGRDSILR
jgi:hypothetical protein